MSTGNMVFINWLVALFAAMAGAFLIFKGQDASLAAGGLMVSIVALIITNIRDHRVWRRTSKGHTLLVIAE